MRPCTKKIIGCDFELWNAILGRDRSFSFSGPSAAADRLLAEIRGFPVRPDWGTSIECQRRFLSSNGGSAYIDSDHLEINTPEHACAADHPAVHFAGLRLAARAAAAASSHLADGSRIRVSAALCDRRASWGHHLNVLAARSYFRSMFNRKPHLLGALATHLATATIFTGAGKVGAANGRAACDFQLSQRADWFEELVGLQTMHERPLVNCRDESHAMLDQARLHIIYFDNVLCPTARYLMAGTTQLVCAMGEAGWIDPNLQLDDPVVAALEVSRDLTLRRRLRMARRGLTMTAAEIQAALADSARAFLASGGLGDAVPGAEAIIARWQDTADLARRCQTEALARLCDWALKFLLLERHRGRKGLTWQSPELVYLDILFSDLDPERGLFWQMASAGQVDAMPDPTRVERFLSEPPDDTRAFLRAHALRQFGDQVHSMDWDHIRFRQRNHRHWYTEARLDMPDPARLGRDEAGPQLERCQTIEDLVDSIEATPANDAWAHVLGSARPGDAKAISQG
jgi:proteasome accessory factor A